MGITLSYRIVFQTSYCKIIFSVAFNFAELESSALKYSMPQVCFGLTFLASFRYNPLAFCEVEFMGKLLLCTWLKKFLSYFFGETLSSC